MKAARKLSAIMFTDIEGYTSLMQRSEQEAIAIRDHHREIFQSTTIAHQGQILQYYGDGTLSIFDSSVEAVRCAYDMQRLFLTHPVIPVRIGIHTGDILVSDEDIIGNSVNVASRVESMGIPGSVLMSNRVYEDIKNQEDMKVKLLGSFKFKNVQESMKIWALSNPGLVIPNPGELRGKLESPKKKLEQPNSILRNRAFFMGLIFLASAALLTIGLYKRNQKEKLDNQLQRIIFLSEDLSIAGAQSGEGANAWKAFRLALEAEAANLKTEKLAKLYPNFSRPVSIMTDPPGASVEAKAYEESDSMWFLVGRTPLDSIVFPFGYSSLRITKEGHEELNDAIWNSHLIENNFQYRLMKSDSSRPGMVYIHLSDSKNDSRLPEDFWMDRYEVTNRQFQDFVNAGGYHKSEFWEYPFYKDGKLISQEAAFQFFLDQTGQPGPTTWIGGTFPKGKDDHPVSGVSWYEAAAYAKYADKHLPTIYHWQSVAANELGSVIVPRANFSMTGSVVTGSSKSINRFGIHDLAGNVREWMYNSYDRQGWRLTLGGGWSQFEYRYAEPEPLDAFDRSEINGFRSISYPTRSAKVVEQENWIQPERPLNYHLVDTTRITAETFLLYKNQFDYDPRTLASKLDTTFIEEHWIREKISFNAAYGKDRMIAYLFLPKNLAPPYQTVIYYPASNAHTESGLQIRQIDFLLKNGRAVMYPVYLGMHERRNHELFTNYNPNEWKFLEKEKRIRQIQDLKRSIDYLETREDIDTDKIGYLGISWGGLMGAIALATDKRLKAAVLIVAGLTRADLLPEINERHYLSYVDQPVLMMNGKYDYYFNYESSQKPFYQLLGTAAEHKEMIVFDCGHSVPKIEMIRKSLTWFDRYLGPVRIKGIDNVIGLKSR